MTTLHEELAALKEKAFQHFENDDAYQRIRIDLIELLRAAHSDYPQAEYAAFKLDVMCLLCDICGTHLDLDVLERYCPDIISRADIERIIHNSALSRWM